MPNISVLRWHEFNIKYMWATVQLSDVDYKSWTVLTLLVLLFHTFLSIGKNGCYKKVDNYCQSCGKFIQEKIFYVKCDQNLIFSVTIFYFKHFCFDWCRLIKNELILFCYCMNSMGKIVNISRWNSSNRYTSILCQVDREFFSHTFHLKEKIQINSKKFSSINSSQESQIHQINFNKNFNSFLLDRGYKVLKHFICYLEKHTHLCVCVCIILSQINQHPQHLSNFIDTQILAIFQFL